MTTSGFSMLENGLDFIASGLRYISGPASKSDLKYAVLHLASGIELVLKERLAREDWRLLFQDPAKAKEQAFKSGDFFGINLKTCLERIEEHCPVEMPDVAQLTAYKHRRNRFEHFGVSESKEAVEASSVIVLGTLLDFINEAFDEADLIAAESDLLQQIRASLADFERFTRARCAAIEPVLKKWREGFGQVVACPCCMQEGLKADCDVECSFCGYKSSANEAAERYISDNIGDAYSIEKDGGTYPLHECPNCGNSAMVFEEGSDEDSICFACGDQASPGDYELCESCREPCDSEDRYGGMCPDCLSAHIAEDHR
jgi:hypothetical protein